MEKAKSAIVGESRKKQALMSCMEVIKATKIFQEQRVKPYFGQMIHGERGETLLLHRFSRFVTRLNHEKNTFFLFLLEKCFRFFYAISGP